MKKAYLAAFAILALVVSASLVGYYLANANGNQIDTSWTANVTAYLNEAQPYPQWQTKYTLNAYSISLIDGGKSTFVNASNGNDFSRYLLEVLSKANKQLNSSVSDSFVTKLVEADRVVYLSSRLGERFTQAQIPIIWDIYYVLDDKLNQGLTGTIFIEHDVNGTRMWQNWAISK